MSIQDWLNNTTQYFLDSSVASARLDALVLLANVSNKSHAWLLAHSQDSIALLLSAKQQQELSTNIMRRANSEPIAYIIGHKEFYGRDFYIDKNVLIPRPESESFIELFKKFKPKPNQKLLDMGTGSGCLAITAKLEFPSLSVTAADVSQSALLIAQNNANNLGANIDCIQSDLFTSITKSFDYILANLPYVPTTLAVSKEVQSEPAQAVFSGPDGLDCIKEFLTNVPNHLNSGGLVFIEALLNQHKDVQILAHSANLTLLDSDSLVQLYTLI